MNMTLPAPVAQALDRLEQAGYAAFVVGGCVRDRVLGFVPHDYDITTAAKPEDMRRVFSEERTIETGVQHGTLTVLLQGMPLEITTFRVDGAYRDGRHPDSVRFTSRVEDDLSRRDFTINAMAYSPRAGLIDPFGGRADCEGRIVRCVGRAEERFGEDALRILRALRFSSRLGFPIEADTDRAVRAGRERLTLVSRERIAAELTGLLQGTGASEVLSLYPEVIIAVLPELKPLAENDQWQLSLRALAACPADPPLRWAALLQNAGENGADSAGLALRVLRGLKMPVKTMETVSQLAAWRGAPLTAASLHEMLVHVGPERLAQLIRLRRANRIAGGEARDEADAEEARLLSALDTLLRENACYTLSQLQVNGRDMAAAGLKGPAIGQALNGLLLRVARGEIPNERSALLAAAASL